MPLAGLPLELLLHIFEHLSVGDILRLRQTSHAFAQLTRERAVWHDALRIHVVDAHIPEHTLRGRAPAALLAAELEAATRHALTVRQNWTSAEPQASRVTEIRTVPDEGMRHARTYAAHFLPGSDDRYLLTLTRLERTPREYVVQCWDLHQPHVPCVARYSTPNLRGMQLNAQGGHPVVLTLTCDVPNEGILTFACGLNFSARDPDDAFHVLQQFASLGTTVKLDGATFFATDDSGRITAYSVDSGAVLYVLRVPLFHNDQTIFLREHKCLSLQVIGAFVLTFCQQWTHLYALPSPSSPTSPIPELDPVAKHRWPYRIDTLKSAPLHPHPLAAHFHPNRTSTYPPIYLLLRFDSWYPWPVNILHAFILPPNPTYVSSSSTPALPYLDGPAETAAPRALTSAPSPLRLFTPADTALGAYGAALWLDAQTGAPGQAGDRGQRVAGCVLPLPRAVNQAVERGLGEGEAASNEASQGGAAEGAAGAPRHAVNLEAPAAEARTARFLLREDAEEWARLALGAREGRLAVACVDGRVLVYDYT